jgi:hypothetical protein
MSDPANQPGKSLLSQEGRQDLEEGQLEAITGGGGCCSGLLKRTRSAPQLAVPHQSPVTTPHQSPELTDAHTESGRYLTDAEVQATLPLWRLPSIRSVGSSAPSIGSP